MSGCHTDLSLVSVPQIKSTAIIASSALPQPKKEGSKAWIAGAVVGPILGLALIGAAVFFILRRRKNKKTTITPQQGGASMAQASPSHPPAGPGGYTETKPQFTPQSQPYGQPYAQPAPQDQYVQQGAYAAQQGYAAAPMSPAPQYDGPSQYNAPGSPPSQYSAPSSPPPQQGYYGQPDVKHAYSGAPQGGAFELGDGSNGIASAAPVSPAAELGGASPQHATQGQYGHTELPTTHR
jgi:LPXTG-motif cell wall-anchored protein